MAEKRLDEAQIDALLEKHGSDRMPEQVWRNFAKIRCPGVALQRHSDGLFRESSPKAVPEKICVGTLSRFLSAQVSDQSGAYFRVTDRNQSFLIPFALDENGPFLEIDRGYA
jgi:hypothetical protein